MTHMVHFQVRPLTTFVLAALLRCLAISLVVVPVGSVASALAQSGAGFTSPTTLLLKQSSLPRGFRYRGSFVQRSVERWDGDIAPVLAIDEQNGWLIAAQESALDRAGRT